MPAIEMPVSIPVCIEQLNRAVKDASYHGELLAIRLLSRQLISCTRLRPLPLAAAFAAGRCIGGCGDSLPQELVQRGL